MVTTTQSRLALAPSIECVIHAADPTALRSRRPVYITKLDASGIPGVGCDVEIRGPLPDVVHYVDRHWGRDALDILFTDANYLSSLPHPWEKIGPHSYTRNTGTTCPKCSLAIFESYDLSHAPDRTRSHNHNRILPTYHCGPR
jgi:hypothetical protein